MPCTVFHHGEGKIICTLNERTPQSFSAERADQTCRNQESTVPTCARQLVEKLGKSDVEIRLAFRQYRVALDE